MSASTDVQSTGGELEKINGEEKENKEGQGTRLAKRDESIESKESKASTGFIEELSVRIRRAWRKRVGNKEKNEKALALRKSKSTGNVCLGRTNKRKTNEAIESKSSECSRKGQTMNAGTADERTKEKHRESNEHDEFLSVRSRKIKSRRRKSKRIIDDEKKEKFAYFLRNIFDLGVKGVLEEYVSKIKFYRANNVTWNAFLKNPGKNRYKDIPCIDQTRVILDGENDYIHANYVRGPPLSNTFICTQGPTKNTVNDFWQMVWQTRARVIVMLCDFVEMGKMKCYEYLPLRVGQTMEFAGISVENKEFDDKSDTTLVFTKLEASYGDERLPLTHIHWRNWPDKGVPKSVMAPFRLLRKAKTYQTRPCIVHCSAGVGRTGTIVAIELILQHIIAGSKYTFIEIIQNLRSMRAYAVQNEDQMIYALRCIMSYSHALRMFDDRPFLRKRLLKFLDEYDIYRMKRTLQISAPPPTNGGQLQKQNIVKDTNFPQYAPQFAVCNPCRPSYELTAQQAKDENSMNENAQRLPLDLMRIPTTDDQYLEPPTGNKNPPLAHELEDIALEHNKNPVEQQKLLTPQIITNEKERMKDEVDHVRVAENVQPAVNSDVKQGAKVDQKLYQPNDAAGNKGTKPAMLQKDQAVKPLTPQKDQLAKDWLTPKNQAVKPLTQKDQLAKESLTPRNQAVKPLTSQKDQLAKESLTPRNQVAKPLTPQKDQLAKDSLTPRNQAVKPLTSQEDQLAKESLTPRNQAAKPLTPQKDQLAKQSLTLEDQGFKGTPPQKATPQQPMRTQMAPSNEDEKRAMKTTIEHQAVHLIPEQIRSQTSMTESKQNTNTTEWTLKSDETLLSAGTSSSLNTAAERTSRKEELPPSSPAVYCSNSSSCEVEEKNGRKSPKFVDSVYFPAGHF